MAYPKVTTNAFGQPEQGARRGVPASPRFPEIEQRVLDHWQVDGTFRASIENRPAGENGENEFVFYDGPPFANGLPHYGHLLTGYVKDVVPRYQTMRGRRVERRFGWDTHGLPAELEAMRQLGLTEKAEIEAMGVGKFNEASKAAVFTYTKEWEDYVTRQARWVDFEHDYKTLDLDYMESVMWAFKELHTKGLIYEGYYVLPYCWNDETPLSNHELRMDDDVYQDRQDNTVTVTLPMTGEKAEQLGLAGVAALAWTTTPWTLPSNEALCVGPEIEYVVLPVGGEVAFGAQRVLLAKDLLGSYAKHLGYGDATAALDAVTATFRGEELRGVRYEPLFDYYTDTERFGTQNAWQVLVDDYVTTTDGTGVVHQSPAYGEDDARICQAAGIPTIVTVDDGARYLPAVADWAGMQVFEANKPITQRLKADGRLVEQHSYVHSYPHCWRCRKPLIYKAVSSWFVRTSALKEKLLANNEQIEWVPSHIQHGAFGKWLANLRDWPISRNRYWGSPIPVWKSDDPEYPRVDVYGSLDEIERDFGVRPDDLHRPYVDELTRPNPDDPTGRSTMRRIPEILDCWFESGSMSFAQVHYPFENREWFENHFPGDFIVEYVGQVRGWFYTMHVMATALFDRPAFSRAVVHGILLGSDGQKMSKSLRNYPDVSEVFDRDGADAMRWFLMSAPVVRGGTLVVTEQAIRDAVRQVLLPLWNTWYFFSLYANAAKGGAGYEYQERTDADDPMDQFVLAATGKLVRDVQARLDAYEISEACEEVRQFLDMLSNWYVRRSRQRFWDEDEQAFDVLGTVLETVCRVAAPLLPLVTEEIWRGLTGGRSVHLTDWPDGERFPTDDALVSRMERTRAVCSTGNALRKASNLRVRLPLAGLTCVLPDAAAYRGTLAGVVADELNVRDVTLVDAAEVSAADYGIEQKLVVNARAAGPRLGKQVQQAIKGSKSGDWSVGEDGTVTSGGLDLVEGEYTLETIVSGAAAEGSAVAMLPGGGFVVLDTRVTPELAAEGLARDVIRAVQQARKDADLDVADRIVTTLALTPGARTAVLAHEDLVMGETLSETLDLEDLADGAGAVSLADGERLTVTVRRR